MLKLLVVVFVLVVAAVTPKPSIGITELKEFSFLLVLDPLYTPFHLSNFTVLPTPDTKCESPVYADPSDPSTSSVYIRCTTYRKPYQYGNEQNTIWFNQPYYYSLFPLSNMTDDPFSRNERGYSLMSNRYLFKVSQYFTPITHTWDITPIPLAAEDKDPTLSVQFLLDNDIYL